MLIRYLLSHGLSLLGNSIAAIALPWLVLIRTGDAAVAGMVAAVSALPMLLAAVTGGVIIDRFGRRRSSVGADIASAAAVAALPLVDQLSGLTVAWFVVLGVAGAIFDVPGMTAREALAPDVAAAAGVSIERLGGLREGISGVVLIAGPAAAGAAISLLDPATVLWATAGCSALAALTTATLPAGVGAAAKTERESGSRRRRALNDLVHGFNALRGDRVIATLTLVSTGSLFIIGPLQNLVLPVHLVAIDSPGGFGLVVAFMALGGIAGSSVYAAVGARFPRRTLFVFVQITTAVGTVGMALLLPTPLLLAAAAVAGFGAGPLPALLLVLVTERIAEQARGRVMGLQNAVTISAVPLGTLASGLLIEGIGLRPTGALLGAAWVLVAVVTLLLPTLRDLDAEPDVAVAQER
ncbi:MFS transporter [Saccharopolyspora sp. NFXS83]|uniref:MFS transporter n=1 Tax=Saccharopolyspora sp. NFXS83 TaxID=2993560 RepID=UPI00224B3E97|nr:MFS transporter [Saccharopolyspora sp. NFXS83]MCX2729192.1 MFS transporter [Saccharopolyspora sp. NFXS83]